MRTPTLALILLLAGCSKGTDDSGTTPALPDGPLSYTPVAPWEQYPFEDNPVRMYIPPDPIGVVFFAHGTNGNVSIVNHIEIVAFLNELAAVHIGFFATDSGQQPEGKWIDGDVERVGRLYQHILDTTELEPTDALLSAGFSGGGNMAGDLAAYALEQGWPIKAINPNQSSCLNCADLGLPTVWVLSENDTGPHEWANQAHDALVEQGVPTEIHHVYEKIVGPDSFLKDPQMNEGRSQRVFDDLIAKELIDADGVRRVPTEEADNWCSWYGNNGECFAPQSREDELRVLWALHRFTAEPARKVRDFFLDAL